MEGEPVVSRCEWCCKCPSESLLAAVQPGGGIITSRQRPIGCEAEETGAKPLRRAAFGDTLQGF